MAGQGDGAGESGALVLADSIKADLRTERAAVIGSALAADPDLAHDLLLFKTVADLLGRTGSISYAFGVTASIADRPHGKPDEVDGQAAATLADLFASLDLTWWADGKSMPERFEAFRAVEPAMKSRIVAVALADAIKPSDLGYSEPLLAHVARQIVPELRAVWRPTGGAFFGRLMKSVLLVEDLTSVRDAERGCRAFPDGCSRAIGWWPFPPLELCARPASGFHERPPEAARSWQCPWACGP